MLVVNGTLTLTDGQVINGTLNALGNVVLASTFDGGGTTLLISGNAVRTFTLPAGAGDAGADGECPERDGEHERQREYYVSATSNLAEYGGVTNGAVNWTFNNVVTVNTNVTQGSGDLVYNRYLHAECRDIHPVGWSAGLQLAVHANWRRVQCSQWRGDALPPDFTISGGTFNAGSGTVVFDGSVATVDVATTQSFNNLTFNTPGGGYKVVDSSDVLVVNGTLTLTDGQVINGTLNALGNVVLASTFDGGGTTLLISGNAVRTFTLPAGAGVPALTVNAPNVTVNTSGSGSITFPLPVTWQSTAGVTNGAVNWTFNNVVTVNTNVTQGSGDLVYNDSYTQKRGTFTPSAGVLDYNSPFTLTGGVFNAPSGVVTFASGLHH